MNQRRLGSVGAIYIVTVRSPGAAHRLQIVDRAFQYDCEGLYKLRRCVLSRERYGDMSTIESNRM